MKDKQPSEDEEQMTEKPKASEVAPDGAAEVEEVVVELGREARISIPPGRRLRRMSRIMKRGQWTR